MSALKTIGVGDSESKHSSISTSRKASEHGAGAKCQTGTKLSFVISMKRFALTLPAFLFLCRKLAWRWVPAFWPRNTSVTLQCRQAEHPPQFPCYVKCASIQRKINSRGSSVSVASNFPTDRVRPSGTVL